jgi:arylsulfatase A-like enzyme
MKYFSILLVFITVFSPQVPAQQEDKPNVLFIISDDLTAAAVSSYENDLGQTPNIDRLASKGVRFTRAYSQFPVCGPSRASLMFGYYPDATTTYGYVSGREDVGPDRNSWAQLFRENGYFTARVSKIYHMGVPGDIEEGSNGTDDEASWTERYNSPGPEWKAEGEAELVQNNPYGQNLRHARNVIIVSYSYPRLHETKANSARLLLLLLNTPPFHCYSICFITDSTPCERAHL